MASEWKESTLEELSVGVSYGYTESASQDKVGPHFLRITDIQNGVVDWQSVPFCPISEKDHLKYKLNEGDIVVARTGNSTGENYIFEGDHDAVYASYLIKFRIDEALAYPKFVWYTMRTASWWAFITGSKTGSAQAGANAKVLGRFPVPLPPLPEQKAIAHILGSLDDKIEFNRKMNATLEGMAQALFKSWFQDFDPVIDNILTKNASWHSSSKPSPSLSQRERDRSGGGDSSSSFGRSGDEGSVYDGIPEEFADRAETRYKVLASSSPSGRGGGEGLSDEVRQLFPDSFQSSELGPIPTGWKKAKLSDLLDIKYGKDHKKLAEGTIPVYGSGGLMRHADKSIYTGESVLIPRKGTLCNILYLNKAFWTVDTMFYTIPQNKCVAKYAFYHLKSLDFESMNVGSAVPSMTTKVLNELPLVMPSETILQKFDSILTSYFDRTEENNMQSKILANLRDTLLPRLISGELRIVDAEKLAKGRAKDAAKDRAKDFSPVRRMRAENEGGE